MKVLVWYRKRVQCNIPVKYFGLSESSIPALPSKLDVAVSLSELSKLSALVQIMKINKYDKLYSEDL
ncbi:hypothetical protein TSAR_002918 [Trichomalopsis sarcophagae]|uniref:Uncharacterized protein n=1 Tax=Trichomalopsis sarcophagae TaxID=543379 RepID=A0A232ERD4_9HYME|nr:hypothetical protein TSAR_002918 [Trichomalopsis sarcophagae]